MKKKMRRVRRTIFQKTRKKVGYPRCCLCRGARDIFGGGKGRVSCLCMPWGVSSREVRRSSWEGGSDSERINSRDPLRVYGGQGI